MKIIEVDDFGFDINVGYVISADDEITITNVWIVNDSKEIDVFEFISDDSYERLENKIIEAESEGLSD